MTVRVHVEGGGDRNKALDSECRRGFVEFFRKAGVHRHTQVVACGARSKAWQRFQTAVRKADAGEYSILLVDSEEPVTSDNPWEHVRNRREDGWRRPDGVQEDQLHLMVEAMEAWFHADVDGVSAYYGKGFRANRLISLNPDVERISKSDLLKRLKQATRTCQKGEYEKGGHSFQILALIDPARVAKRSRHAKRLLNFLSEAGER